MRIKYLASIVAALAALLVTTTTVIAQTDFTLKKRVPAQTVDRYGNLSLGAVIRTDERYGQIPCSKGRAVGITGTGCKIPGTTKTQTFGVTNGRPTLYRR